MNQTNDPMPTKSTLLRRLKDLNDQDSWRLFCETYNPLIYNTAIRAGLTHAEAEDVCQETARSAKNSMPAFRYDRQKGSFKGWLLQLVCWRIYDQIKKRDTRLDGRDRAETSTGTALVERQPNPPGTGLEGIWDDEWKAELIKRATDNIKHKVDPRHYQVFDLLFFKHWPAAKTARFSGINVGRVYLIKHRVAKLMTKEIANLRDTLI